MSEISEEGKNEIRQSEDYKIAKNILGPMYRNIVGIRKKLDLTRPDFERYEFHPHYADFRQNCQEFKETWKEAEKVSKVLKGLKITSYPSLEYESMSKILAYLGLVESLGVTLADAILILLIANGKEVHTREPKHVTKVKELKEVNLAISSVFWLVRVLLCLPREGSSTETRETT